VVKEKVRPLTLEIISYLITNYYLLWLFEFRYG